MKGNKKMKKISFLILLITSFCLISCGKKEEDETVSENTVVKITVTDEELVLPAEPVEEPVLESVSFNDVLDEIDKDKYYFVTEKYDLDGIVILKTSNENHNIKYIVSDDINFLTLLNEISAAYYYDFSNTENIPDEYYDKIKAYGQEHEISDFINIVSENSISPEFCKLNSTSIYSQNYELVVRDASLESDLSFMNQN